jgi:hypothetical protein
VQQGPLPPFSEFHVDDNRRRICTECVLYVPGNSLPRVMRLSCAFAPGKKLFGSSILSSDRTSKQAIHPSIRQSVVTFAGEYVMLGLTNLYSIFQTSISDSVHRIQERAEAGCHTYPSYRHCWCSPTRPSPLPDRHNISALDRGLLRLGGPGSGGFGTRSFRARVH